MTPYYEEPLVTLYQGDVREVLAGLPEIADMVICSPPYYGLRKYDGDPIVWDSLNGCKHEWDAPRMVVDKPFTYPDGAGSKKNVTASIGTQISQGSFCLHCGCWRGQLGLEPTPELYIKHLCDIFDQVKKVLKKTGGLWVNLDDSYAGSGKSSGQEEIMGGDKQRTNGGSLVTFKTPSDASYRPKSLIGIPARFQLEMMNRGWVCRNVIIWHKPNPMPESVKDRFTSDFEYLYLFSQQGDYYFEQQFEPQKMVSLKRLQRSHIAYQPDYPHGDQNHVSDYYAKWEGKSLDDITEQYPNRNKRCVWSVPTHGFDGAHFATYPEKLVETPILAGCPKEICRKCGKPRVKIYRETPYSLRPNSAPIGKRGAYPSSARALGQPQMTSRALHSEFIAYSDCGCGEGFVPGVVLDIFSGSGTSCAVAKRLGRKSIGIELSEKYNKLAIKRIQKETSPML